MKFENQTILQFLPVVGSIIFFLLNTEGEISLVVLTLSNEVGAVLTTIFPQQTLCLLSTNVTMEPSGGVGEEVCVCE